MLSIIYITVSKFINNIPAFLLVGAEAAVQEVLEKEYPEDGKHDKEFYQDDNPESPPPGHRAEAVVIEEKDS
jgi:hypothetical protein